MRLALAIRCEELVRTGVFANYTAIAELGDVSRTRVTQIMNLVNLAPDIQEALLDLPRFNAGHEPILLAELQGIAKVLDWARQRMMCGNRH